MATELIGRERTGNARLSGGKDGFSYSETYDYLVMSDDPFEDYWNVITTAGLPQVLVTEVNGIKCTGKTANRDSGHAGLWRVSCEFTQETTGQETGTDPDPTTWIPIWTGSIETYDEVLLKAKTSSTATGTLSGSEEPYMNSAKDLFPDPLIKRRPIIVMEFVQYEAYNLDPDEIAARNDTINNAAFKGFGARTLKLNVRAFTKGIYYIYPPTQIAYVVAYKPSVWCDGPLDIGYEYRAAAGTAKIQSPVLVALNTDGTAKASTSDAVVNKYWFPHTELDFSSFIR